MRVASPEELQRIMRDMVEWATVERKSGKMHEPFNMAHFEAKLKRNGIAMPKAYHDQTKWAKDNGLTKLAKKLKKRRTLDKMKKPKPISRSTWKHPRHGRRIIKNAIGEFCVEGRGAKWTIFQSLEEAAK